jgi:hypothetical protein
MASKPKIDIEHVAEVGKPGKPRYRTAIGPDGEKVKVRIVDPNSPTFTADFLSMFRANVKHARQENKALGLDV